MYKANKSFSIMSLAFGLVVFFFTVFTSLVLADENYGNLPPDVSMMGMSSLESIDLPFDPNDFSFLIYNPGGDESSIEAAMKKILGRELYPSEIRGPGNEVTLEDLETHDILIVGWNAGGNTTGLHSDDLAAGITGRVILSGHDLDFHTVKGPTNEIKESAERCLVQAIDWVLKGGGTGMITLGDSPYSGDAFSYLPGCWGVSAQVDWAEDIDNFTLEGLTSGVYNELKPEDMSDWGTAYHDIFTIDQDSTFVPFELGVDDDHIITVARLWPVSSKVELTKTDDVNDGNSVRPGDYIMYTISYANPTVGPNYVGTLTDVNIVDYLPDEINYCSSDPCGVYDSDKRSVTWNIGTLPPGDSNSVELTVTVNNLAEPLGTIRNLCVLGANEIWTFAATEITDVNSWKPDIIYVDRRAPGSNTGMSWKNAYRNLQKALARARAGYGCQIWVAAETYKPTQNIYDTDANFALVNGVPIYGGFAGNETSTSQRNPADVNNETILDGQIGAGYAVKYIVKANGIDDAIVDGFTIRGSYYESGYGAGVYLNDSDVSIVNCKIKDNYHSGYGIDITNNSHPYIHNCLFIDNSDYGINCDHSRPVITNSTFDGNYITPSAIFAISSDVKLTDCIVKNHTGYGIFVDNNNIEINHSLIERNSWAGLSCSGGSTLTLTNSVIRFNSELSGNYGGYPGIYLDGISSATIKNNWIHNNGTDADDYGIYVSYTSSPAIIRNNTIVHNPGYGIYLQSGPEPNISNCIIWDNDTGQLFQCSASYSCTTDDPGPGFMNIQTDPNDLHIAENSACKNAGDPAFVPDLGETDIDGEGRVKDGRVDIGADEYYWSPADFNDDEIVNFIDYAIFAKAWKTQNSGKSLDGDSDVDIYDLKLFCEDWLWQAGWTKTFTCGAGQDMGQTMGWSMSQAMTAALVPTVGTAVEVSYPSVLAEQQSMLAGEDETAGIWLVYDGNMTPNSGDEITIYIHSDPMLLCMGIIVEIAGDANITTAMSEADCNNYGWDNGWNSDPYIDPNGWLFISGVSWESVVNGTVGYFKFRYNSGEVTVSVTEESCAYDAYYQPVLFSLEPLIFGRDPNEQ
jgi:parallel beta-helix repeat protein